MYGTIHLIDKDKFVLPESVIEKLKESEKLFLELGDFNDQATLMKLAFLEEGKLTDMLSQKEKDSVYAYVENEFGIDSAAFEKVYGKFKPFFFAQLGMMKLVLNSESYDKTLGAIAIENDIPLIGLETMEQQVSFFDRMPPQLQKEMVMYAVRNQENASEDWDKMQDAYLKQDFESVMEVDKSSVELRAYMESVLMKNRNENWMVKLTDELNLGNLFIGVGAAHLVGEFGLVQLLTKEGYIVEPIIIQLTK